MENKKTISYLNSKAWYRLIKVVFIGVIVLSILLSVLVIVDSHSPQQVKDYKINCIADYTNKKTFFAEKDADIYFFPYGTETVYESIRDDQRLRLRDVCGISSEEADKSNNETIAYINEQIKLGTDEETIEDYLDKNFRAYTILETNRTEGGYLIIIAYSLLSVVILLLIAELVRRIFYYVVLGKIRPEK